MGRITSHIRLHSPPEPPIDRVPVEILCRIFLILLHSPPPGFALPDFGPYHRSRALPTVIAVCRRWRSTASECAVLWANIAFTTTLLSTVRGAALFLSRSKDAMLSVHIWDPIRPAGDPEVEKASRELIEAIASQSHRISFCELSSSSPGFWRNWTLPAPYLRKLVVKGHCLKASPVFGGVIPRLGSLNSLNYTPWPLGNYTALRKADLRNYERRASLTTLLGALQGCETLEKLTLHGYANLTQDRLTPAPILLPRLHRINLFSCNSALILEYLDVPTLVGPIVIYDTNPPQHILQCLPSIRRRKPYLDGIEQLHVVFEASLGIYSVAGCREGGRTSFYIRAQGVRDQARWRWTRSSIEAVASCVQFSSIRTLTLVTDSATIPWAVWLPNLSHMRRLSVSSPRSEDILRALLTSSPEDGSPFCPSLRSLAIYRCGDYGVIDHVGLMELVLHRYWVGRPIRRVMLHRDEWEWIQQLDQDGSWVFLAESQCKQFDS